MLNNNKRIWIATALGCIALIIWGFGALLVVSLNNIPRFELVTIVFASSCYLSICRISVNRSWYKIKKVSWKMWAFGIMGIYGANLSFVYAMQCAPPEKVDLINYLWPILVTILSPLVFKAKVNFLSMLGVAIAFAGIFVVLTNGASLAGFEMQYWPGFLLALLNVIFWGTYVIVSKKNSTVPNEMIGLYCGIGAICSLIIHCYTENFLLPSNKELVTMITIGLTGQGLAYILWDYGIKSGHYYLLCTLSYFTPILSILLLVKFQYTMASDHLWIAATLVSLGACLAEPKFIAIIKKSIAFRANSKSTVKTI